MNTAHLLSRCTLVAAFGAVAALGCDRRDDRYTRTTVVTPVEAPGAARDLPPKNLQLGVGGGPVEIGLAVDKIVAARCDRDMKCGNVGQGKKFATRDACMSSVKEAFADDLNVTDCPAGIDLVELSECLTDARNEDCNNPFDTIGRIAACRTSDICRHAK